MVYKGLDIETLLMSSRTYTSSNIWVAVFCALTHGSVRYQNYYFSSSHITVTTGQVLLNSNSLAHEEK